MDRRMIAAALIAAALVLSFGCGRKPQTRGIVAGPVITAEDIRKDPESFIGKQVCFYADTNSTAYAEGYDFADTADKEVWLRWPGQKGTMTEDYIYRIEENLPFGEAELGKIYVYFDCKLPVHLLDRGVDTALNHIRIFNPEEYIKKGEKMPGTGRKADGPTVLPFNLPGTIFSGYIFEAAAYLNTDSLAMEVERMSGKKVYRTNIKVFMTGFKTP